MAGVKGKSGGYRKGAGRPQNVNGVSQKILDTLKNVDENELDTTVPELVTCSMQNLDFPEELAGLPYAKETWSYVLKLNEASSIKLINERHYESLKSYCTAVSMRQMAIDAWIRECRPMTINTKQGLKAHPLLKEISEKSTLVNKFAEDLGLTVLSELKMIKAKNNVPSDDKKDPDDDDMF